MPCNTIYFNPRAPYGARLRKCHKITSRESNFNPRAPYGARPAKDTDCATNQQFQSTRPIRGATTGAIKQAIARNHFNPRAPYGARLELVRNRLCLELISIHAPHTGRDGRRQRQGVKLENYFNPRAPYGARLGAIFYVFMTNVYFNPRAPYGARPP